MSRVDEHIAAARRALQDLDRSPGSPAETVAAKLHLIEVRGRELREKVERADAARNELAAAQTQHTEKVRTLEREIDRLQQVIRSHKTENEKIRGQHADKAGQVGAVIHELRDALTASAAKLLDLTR